MDKSVYSFIKITWLRYEITDKAKDVFDRFYLVVTTCNLAHVCVVHSKLIQTPATLIASSIGQTGYQIRLQFISLKSSRALYDIQFECSFDNVL